MNTVSVSHDLNACARLLKLAPVLVGIPPTPYPQLDVGSIIGNRLTVAASAIGGISQNREILDFRAAHHIVPCIETRIAQVSKAGERMLKGDVKCRFVIEMATLKS